jgi:hypothetical protein
MSHNIAVECGKTVRLPTAGKYCDRDIVVTATGGGGGSELVDALLDGSVEEIESNVTKIGERALNYRRNLEKVSLPNVTSIGAYAFDSSFRSVALPTLFLPNLTTAGDRAFYASGVSTAILPKLNVVSSQMFNYSVSLVSIDLGVATQIEGAAFSNCSKLKTVIIRTNSVCSLAYATVFNSTPIKSGSGYIYVPSALVDSYKTATNWSTYASQIRAIEDYPEICGG